MRAEDLLRTVKIHDRIEWTRSRWVTVARVYGPRP